MDYNGFSKVVFLSSRKYTFFLVSLQYKLNKLFRTAVIRFSSAVSIQIGPPLATTVTSLKNVPQVSIKGTCHNEVFRNIGPTKTIYATEEKTPLPPTGYNLALSQSKGGSLKPSNITGYCQY